MSDDRRRISGMTIAVLVLLAVLIGGGGVLVTISMRFRMMSQRAEMEARLAAEEAIAQRNAAEHERQRAGPITPDHPKEPLSDLNDTFRAIYREARRDVLASTGPVVIALGDDLILARNGKRISVRAVPPVYHQLKTISHVPLAAFLLTRPGFDADRRAELVMFIDAVEAATANDGTLTNDQQQRHKSIRDQSIQFLKKAEKDPISVSPADRTAFARTMAPLVLADARDAARAQIDGYEKAMAAWRSEMSADEWSRLSVIVTGSQMPRSGNLAVQYFSWLLGVPGEGNRIVYAEGIFDDAKALNLLGTHRVDADVGTAFFDDGRRMDRDLLSDAAREILQQMKPK